jgi:hypothetical protein
MMQKNYGPRDVSPESPPPLCGLVLSRCHGCRRVPSSSRHRRRVAQVSLSCGV